MTTDLESFAVTSANWEPGTPAYRFPHFAMACRFEITILDRPPAASHDAARAAYERLDELEGQLSRFLPGSDVWLIGRLAPGTPLTIGLDTEACLLRAVEVCGETGGVFDPATGALRECWRDDEGTDLTPSDEQLRRALARTGVDKLVIDAENHTVSVKVDRLGIDLGGIGKGYAIDEMAGVLGDWDIETALICGGGSTHYRLGCPAGRKGWRIALGDVDGILGPMPSFTMRDRASSGSGVTADHIHIIDIHTGRLVTGPRATWANAPTAAESDALSTAFLLMDTAQVEEYCRGHEDVGGIVAVRDDGRPRLERFGRWDEPE